MQHKMKPGSKNASHVCVKPNHHAKGSREAQQKSSPESFRWRAEASFNRKGQVVAKACDNPFASGIRKNLRVCVFV